jgi:hypothetical protein
MTGFSPFHNPSRTHSRPVSRLSLNLSRTSSLFILTSYNMAGNINLFPKETLINVIKASDVQSQLEIFQILGMFSKAALMAIRADARP